MEGRRGRFNVAAQQEGLIALCAFLKYGGTEHATRTRGVTIPPISEKGLNSMRPLIKQNALEALLLYIEIDRADPVVEGLIPALSAKQPKVVAANLTAFTSIYHAFGVKIVDPKPVLKALPKIFGHADKNVRTEASNLVVELYRWLREAIKPLFWAELKPVQQQDLEKAFEPIKAEPHPKQERLLRSQQDAPEVVASVGGDVEGEAFDEADDVPAGMDAFDLAEPVDVLAKASGDLFEKLASSKWKDRKEALEGLFEVANVPRIKEAPYDDLMASLAKCMKDANVQVVMIAANNIEVFAKGLRRAFARYRGKVMSPMLERLKEKKQNVADALGAALLAVFHATSLADCLEEITEALGPKNKNPQAKQESARFLVRCLCTTKTAPTDAETKTLAEMAKKLLTESTEVMRSLGAELLGVLMKIKTERKMTPYLEGLDEIRKAKIKEYFENAEVKAKDKPKTAPAPPKPAPGPAARRGPPAKKPIAGSSSGVKKAPTPAMRANSPLLEEAPATPAPKPRMGLSKPGAKPGLAPPSGGLKLQKKLAGPAPGSPKRMAAPAPREEEEYEPAPAPAPRVGLGRGLAGRSLAKPAATAPLASPPRAPPAPSVSAMDRAELDELRVENARLSALVDELRGNSAKLEAELTTLRTHEAELIEERTRSNLQLRAKDTQLVRARSDAEVAKELAAKQTKDIERLKRELSRAVRTASPPPAYVSTNSADGVIYADPSLAGLDRYERDRASKEIGYQRARSYMSSPSEEKENASQDGTSLSIKRMTAPSGASPSRPHFHGIGSDGSASPMGRGSETGDSGPAEGDGSGNIHSWKRAAEVTSQLRARIEQMKVSQFDLVQAKHTKSWIGTSRT